MPEPQSSTATETQSVKKTSPYKRVLLKISGEALQGRQGSGIESETLERLAKDIAEICQSGVQIGLVVGGGNLIRGAEQAAEGFDAVTGDHMGMLATVINALALQDAIEAQGQPVRVMSAIRINEICEGYIRRRAVRHLEKGRTVVFAAGIGNPFFTTDTAASLRALEINADLLIKATKVDGVYSADPTTNPSATFYSRLSFDQALQEKLGVMDATALVLCRDHNIPLRIMNIFKPGSIRKLIDGGEIGSLIEVTSSPL
ncbi:MAG: UMP kinase [Methylococcales bacterium]